MIDPTGGMGMSKSFSTLFKTYIYLFSAAVFNATAVFVIRTLVSFILSKMLKKKKSTIADDANQAIRDSKRPMTIFLWCCYAVVCIFHLCCAGLVQMPVDYLTPDPTSTLVTPLDQYLPWVFFLGLSVAFDCLVLALSIAPQMEGFSKWKPTYSHIAKKFYFDAIGYFAVSLFVSTFDLAWIIAHRYDGILVALTMPM